MRAFIGSTALIASTVLAAQSASAASVVTTEFSGFGFKALDRTYNTADDVKVHVSAYTIDKASGDQTRAMTGGYGGPSGGLGVTSGGTSGGDRFHVNGSAFKSEVIWFEFASLYNVKGILFTHADDDDEVTIYTDGGILGTYAVADFRGGYDKGTLDLAVKTTKIGILAADGADEFLIKGFNGHVAPTPSAALAGLGGLIVLAARRRREQA